MNWKSFRKCLNTDVEKPEQVDYGEELLTITIKVKNITLNKGGKNTQLTYIETTFRLL